MRAFIKAYGCRFLCFTTVGFFAELMTILMVFFIRNIIEFIESEEPDVMEAAYLLCTFICVFLVGFLLRHVYLFHGYNFILILRKSTTALLYKKLLKVS